MTDAIETLQRIRNCLGWPDEIEAVDAAIAALSAQQARTDGGEANRNYREIAHLIGSIFFAGGFKAETFNERRLESLLIEVGTRYSSWDEVGAGDDRLEAAHPAPSPDAVSVDEAMVERALHARMPGGAEAWVFMFGARGGRAPDREHAEMMRRIITAALTTQHPSKGEDDGR